MSSRKLSDLRPDVRRLAEKHVELCADEGVELLIYCTYRDNVEQDELYAYGRTKPGKRRTNCRGGESQHNAVNKMMQPAALGYDCVPVVHGKAIWDTSDPVWGIVIRCGESAGLKASARWRGKLKESCHFGV